MKLVVDPHSSGELVFRAINANEIPALEIALKKIGQLNHPNVASPLKVVDYQSTPHLIRRYIAGDNLSGFFKNFDRLKSLDKAALFRGLMKGVAALHERGVVHGRLHPGNIIVGASHAPVIVDCLTTKAQLLGDPYISPEQIRGKSATKKSDLFSLAILGQQLFDESYPFNGQGSLEISTSILYGEPKRFLGRGLGNEEIVGFIRSALKKRPLFRPRRVPSIN
jgi:serine/threonine protein kinase